MKLPSPLELLRAETDLLYAVLQEVYDTYGPTGLTFRQGFIYRHARNISDLSEDCLHLAKGERWCGPAILVRCILESTFCLSAAFEHPNFAAEKALAEMEHDIRKLTAWKDVADMPSWSEMLRELNEYTSTIRQDNSVTGNKKWSVFETARVAKLENEYAEGYFMYSRHVHATVWGITAQEHKMGIGHIFELISLAIFRAIPCLLQSAPVQNGQSHIDMATHLIDISTGMISAGVFSSFHAHS